MAYNTAVSALMILLNKYSEMDSISKDDYTVLLTLLNPIAPHITEELNEMIGNSPIVDSSWPEYDESKCNEDTKEIGVQVNGKLRGSIMISNDENEESVKEKALNQENVAKYIDGKTVVKVIVVPGRIVNIVIKD